MSPDPREHATVTGEGPPGGATPVRHVICPTCGNPVEARPRLSLTTIQRETLCQFVRLLDEAHGVAPTIRALAAALGKCPTTVHEIVQSLVRKGWLVRGTSTKAWRGYALVPGSREAAGIPAAAAGGGA